MSRLLTVMAIGYVAALPLGTLTIGPGRSISAGLGVAVFALWIVWLLVEEPNASPRSSTSFDTGRRVVFTVLVLYAGWILVAATWTSNVDASRQRIETVLSLIVLVPALARGLAEARGAAVVAYTVSCCVVAGLILVNADGFSQATALDLNQNGASLTLAVAFGWALLGVVGTHGVPRLCFSAAVVLLGLGSLATGSRTGLIALMGTALVVVTYNAARGFRGRGFALGIAVLLLLITSAWIFSDYLPSRLWGVANDIQVGELSNRAEIWEAVWQYREAWIPFGVGPGASVDFVSAAFGEPRVVHNTYLGQLVEVGVVGALLFGLLIVASGLTSVRSPFRYEFAAAAVPTLIFMTTLSLEYDKLFWFLIALSFARPLRPCVSDTVDAPTKAGGKVVDRIQTAMRPPTEGIP